MSLRHHQQHADKRHDQKRKRGARRSHAAQQPRHDRGNQRLQGHDDGAVLGTRMLQTDEHEESKPREADGAQCRDPQRASVDVMPVQGLHRLLRVGVRHLHEAEALRGPRVAVGDDSRGLDLAVRLEEGAERVVVHRIGEVPHVHSHGISFIGCVAVRARRRSGGGGLGVFTKDGREVLNGSERLI